jgi:hypothetical protein
MRKLMAIVALFLCGTAGADAAELQEWCSDGFEKPAKLIEVEGWPNFVLKIDGRPDEPLNTDHNSPLNSASVRVHGEADEEEEETQEIWIYRDRVFWPCDKP